MTLHGRKPRSPFRRNWPTRLGSGTPRYQDSQSPQSTVSPKLPVPAERNGPSQDSVTAAKMTRPAGL